MKVFPSLGLATSARRYVAFTLLAAGFALSLVVQLAPGVALTALLFFAAVAMLFESTCLVRGALAFFGALLLLIPGITLTHRRQIEEDRRSIAYAKAVSFSEAGYYAAAIPLLEQIAMGDPEYRQVSRELKKAREGLAASRSTKPDPR
jgi:hypothetical protein